MRRRFVVTICLALVAACGGAESGSGERIAVVAAFYPLAEVATVVGGDRAEVTNLTAAGVEPHDLDVTARQVDAVDDADIVLFIGGGFQPAVEELARRADAPVIDLLDGVEDAADDPHIWLDPTRMAHIVEQVRDAYIKADAGAAAEYRANAAGYLESLTSLDADFRAGLADCERDTIVTAHAAFGHLASRYGLRQEAIAGLSPEAEPDPDRIADLADEVRTEGITTIFYESLVSPEVAETLAREAGVETAVLNPIEGLSDDELADGADYDSVMRDNLAALRKALACS